MLFNIHESVEEWRDFTLLAIGPQLLVEVKLVAEVPGVVPVVVLAMMLPMVLPIVLSLGKPWAWLPDDFSSLHATQTRQHRSVQVLPYATSRSYRGSLPWHPDATLAKA